MTAPAAPLRLGFAGTPQFAATHLRALLDSRHDVAAVYTQPDRPAGRGRQLVRFVTPPIHPHGWLRLDPLAATGVATLHRIEVHAAGL